MATLETTRTAPDPGPSQSSGRRLPSAGSDVAANWSLSVLAAAAAVVPLLVWVVSGGHYAVDFQYTYWPAGHRLLHGLSPYAASPAQIAGGATFVYPALSALVFAPFALLAHGAADILFMLVCVALVPATLGALNVRDWRVYGVAMLWLPVFEAWQTSNLTAPLLLAVALAWRFRDRRPVAAGVVAAVAVSLKPFVWPLVLWLLLTRRWRAAGWAALTGVAVNLVAWSVVGYGAIGRYLHLSSQVTTALWRDGYGVMAIAGRFGLSQTGAELLLLICSGLLVVGLAWLSLREGERESRDLRMLTLSVALMLVASPLVWSHYFALLLVPLAIALPQLAPVWLLPLAMWVCPARSGVQGWQIALTLAVSGICLYLPYRDAA